MIKMNLEAIAEDLTQRFPYYCELSTGSVEGVTDDKGVPQVPSTSGQYALAVFLAAEARNMGYEVDFLKAGLRVRARATREGIVPLLLGAHLDTSCDAPNDNVEVLAHENYSGNVINLPHIDRKTGNEATTVIDPAESEFLNDYIGDTIFTSNGSTLLGGDDKAGISAIMTFLKYLHKTGEDHGEIDAMFTYDEEIGLEGASLLDTTNETNAK